MTPAPNEGETRGGKGSGKGGGRDCDNGACEDCAGLHRGIRDRGDACNRLRDDAAQGVSGSMGRWRMKRALPFTVFLFSAASFMVAVSLVRSSKGDLFIPSDQVYTPGFGDTAGN